MKNDEPQHTQVLKAFYSKVLAEQEYRSPFAPTPYEVFKTIEEAVHSETWKTIKKIVKAMVVVEGLVWGARVAELIPSLIWSHLRAKLTRQPNSSTFAENVLLVIYNNKVMQGWADKFTSAKIDCLELIEVTELLS